MKAFIIRLAIESFYLSIFHQVVCVPVSLPLCPPSISVSVCVCVCKRVISFWYVLLFCLGMTWVQCRSNRSYHRTRAHLSRKISNTHQLDNKIFGWSLFVLGEKGRYWFDVQAAYKFKRIGKQLPIMKIIVLLRFVVCCWWWWWCFFFSCAHVVLGIVIIIINVTCKVQAEIILIIIV